MRLGWRVVGKVDMCGGKDKACGFDPSRVDTHWKKIQENKVWTMRSAFLPIT